jgi:predicted kinase
MILKLWCDHDDSARLQKEIRRCYRSCSAFAQLLHDAVATAARGGEVVIEAKANARRLLEHLLKELLEQAHADVPPEKISAWQWLELTVHPCTGKRVWQQVLRT